MTDNSNNSCIPNKLVMVRTVLLKHVSCVVVCITATARLTGSLRHSQSAVARSAVWSGSEYRSLVVFTVQVPDHQAFTLTVRMTVKDYTIKLIFCLISVSINYHN